MKDNRSKVREELPEELQPCGHMAHLVSRRSDDSLTGPSKWYTDFHVMTCPHCKQALQGLRELRSEVKHLSEAEAAIGDPHLSSDQWKKVEEEWDKQELER